MSTPNRVEDNLGDLDRRALLGLLAAGLIAVPFAGSLAGERGTPEEAQAMVAKAVAAYGEKSAAVFAEITAPSTAFRDRDLYVFVIGSDHEIVAHGADAKRIGIDVTTLKDPDGKEYGKELVATASASGAWVDYKFKDPLSGNIAQKSSWVVLHDGFIFGCGVYKL